MNSRIPIEHVIGVDEVTVWMWPNSQNPVTVRFSIHEWAKIERKAERVADGDVEAAIGKAVLEDFEENLENWENS